MLIATRDQGPFAALDNKCFHQGGPLGAGSIEKGILVLIIGFLCIAATGAAEPTGQPPVLIELFTSQGCSSCPPADRLLSKLVAEERVIALAFHVDYWNYIGWTDPFSSREWSDRQRSYAAVFGSNRIYTPQLVVNGRWEGVGSDAREVEGLLEEAAGSLHDELVLEIEEDGPRLIVRLSCPAPSGERQAWLAIAESEFSTPVGSGENAHHTLRNDNVVRRLVPVELGEAIAVELEPGWKRENVRLVAFLQDAESMAVTGATQTLLP